MLYAMVAKLEETPAGIREVSDEERGAVPSAVRLEDK